MKFKFTFTCVMIAEGFDTEEEAREAIEEETDNLNQYITEYFKATGA